MAVVRSRARTGLKSTAWLKVEHLSVDIAVVHARLHIDNQTAGPGGMQPAPHNTMMQPAPHNTIMSFVVHRLTDGWSCASAQNTDIVPHMETNMMDTDGTFRPVSFRR